MRKKEETEPSRTRSARYLACVGSACQCLARHCCRSRCRLSGERHFSLVPRATLHPVFALFAQSLIRSSAPYSGLPWVVGEEGRKNGRNNGNNDTKKKGSAARVPGAANNHVAWQRAKDARFNGKTNFPTRSSSSRSTTVNSSAG